MSFKFKMQSYIYFSSAISQCLHLETYIKLLQVFRMGIFTGIQEHAMKLATYFMYFHKLQNVLQPEECLTQL